MFIMKKTLATLVLALASAVGTANADTLVHQSEHYQFFTRDGELQGKYLYAKNFTGDDRYNPSGVLADSELGLGITGRLHQQYLESNEIIGTPTQDSAVLGIFTTPLGDSHWLVNREDITTLKNPSENYNVWESSYLPVLKDEFLLAQPFIRASFGDSMNGVFKRDNFNETELPLAYIVTDDLDSIQCNFWIGRSQVEPMGQSLDGVVSSYSQFASGDTVSFGLNEIPEPSTLTMLVLGGSALLSRRKK